MRGQTSATAWTAAVQTASLPRCRSRWGRCGDDQPGVGSAAAKLSVHRGPASERPAQTGRTAHQLRVIRYVREKGLSSSSAWKRRVFRAGMGPTGSSFAAGSGVRFLPRKLIRRWHAPKISLGSRGNVLRPRPCLTGLRELCCFRLVTAFGVTSLGLTGETAEIFASLPYYPMFSGVPKWPLAAQQLQRRWLPRICA